MKTAPGRPTALMLTLFCVLAQLSLSQNHAARIDSFMQRLNHIEAFNGAILVAREGTVIYSKAFGYADVEWQTPNTTSTKFRIGSLTKCFTALLIMQLVEEGRVKLDGTVSDYLPDYPRTTGERITIHHLLAHRSGIPNYVRDIPDFWSKGDGSRHTPVNRERFVDIFSGLDLRFEPGSKFEYCNSGYYLLGLIIEKVTGKPYEAVLRERILVPVGMDNTGYPSSFRDIIPERARGHYATLGGYENAKYDNPSIYYATGGMYSTVNDMLLLDRALASEKLLSDSSKEKMFTLFHRDTRRGGGYGYGWKIDTVGLDEAMDPLMYVGHAGDAAGFFAWFGRFIEQDLFIVFMTNTNAIGVATMEDVFQPILRILYDRPVVPPKASIARTLLPTILKEGVGAAITQYHELRRTESGKYTFLEGELNDLGYYLLGSGRTEDAIAIFALNVEIYPDAYNTYDSLGEAYMVNGDQVLAVKNYKKSLALNPDNTNARERLKTLTSPP